MATAPGSTEPLAVASWEAAEEAVERSKSDRYLARRLAAAGADVKGVAVTTFLLAAGLAATAWLALGVVVEHWLVPGGLSRATRWTWLATGVVGLALAAARWLLPLVRYRVNLLYAARAIERENPELRNDLVNAVLVKSRPEGAAPVVVRALERRAAKRLSDVAADGVVDRGPAFWLAVALAGLVLAACLYELFAPKSLLVSAARLLAPWASLAAPARVTIEPLRLAWRLPAAAAGPAAERQDHDLGVVAGAATLVRGRQLVVSCDVRGLRPGEPVRVGVTPIRDDGTIDPAAVPWEVPLAAAGSAGRHLAVLPDATRGLQHSVELRVAAGDAPDRRVRVDVVDMASLLVREIRYDYPEYTRREPEAVAWQGDVRAVEGTRVTVVAEGNRPLKSAWIDKGCDGSKDVQLRIGQRDPTRATGNFTLRLDPERAGSGSGSYRLVFEPQAAAPSGREETVVERLEHRIEVLPDLAPEVSVEEPREQVVVVPPDAPVAVRVRALDPDFGLARVGVEARLAGGPTQPEIVIFRGNRPGSLVGGTEIVPARLGAGPGSVIEYRAVAADAKPDPANVAHSPWQVLRVEAGAPPREPPARPDERDAGPRERSPAAGGESQDGADRQAGEAAQDDARQKDSGGQQERPESQGRQSGGEEAADEQAAGQQPGGQQGEQGQQNGAEQSPRDQSGGGQGGERQPANQQGAGQPGAEQPNSRQQGGAKQGDANNGDANNGDANKGDEKQGDEKQGDEKQGDEKQGDEKQGDGKQGDGKQGDGNKGSQQSRSGQQGGNQQGGQPQSGGRPAGEKNGGEKQAGGQRQSGDQRAAGDGSAERAQREAVAADGTNDGEAVERILEQRRREPGNAGEREPRDGGRDNPQCNPAEGKPCSQEGCPTCQGGGKPGGGAGGSSGSGGGQTAGQAGGSQPGGGAEGAAQGGASEAGGAAAGTNNAAKAPGQEGGAGPAGQEPGTDPSPSGKQTKPSSQAQGQGAGAGEQSSQPAGGQAAAGPPEADAEPADSREESGAGGRQDAAPQPADGGPAGDAAQGQAAKPAAGPSDVTASAPGGPVGAGGRTGGDAGEAGADAAPAVPPREMEWTDQDLAHARNAADTAIEHLRDSLAAGRHDVLDALGWTPEQARAFLDRWQALRRMAGSSDPRERGAYDQTLRSLGLRADGVRSSRDVPADAAGGQAEGRRSRPPASYREQFRAYLQGTAGE